MDLDYIGFRLLHERARYLGPEEVRSKRGPTRAETVLDELQAQHVVYLAAESGLSDAVRLAVEFGSSWTQIGLRLGVTRQAAHKRFAASLGSSVITETE